MRRKKNSQSGISANDTQVKMHGGEIDIDSALVRRLLTEQFPQYANKTIRVMRSTGTVNAIFKLGKDLCVRLPRVEGWVDGLERELTWLPKLAPHISLAIPQPIARGKPTSWYPFPWAIYRWLRGRPYEDHLIHDEIQAAHDLANFIKELRNLDVSGAPPGGRKPLIELDTATRSAIESAKGEIGTETVLAEWIGAINTQPWDRKAVWIHGDLLRPNLLVRSGRLYAVLDFGGVGIGDPAADVIPAWSVFNRVGRDAFRRVLDVDDNTWDRARGYALHQALMIIPYYPDTNPEFVALAKRTVREIIADQK